MSADTFICPNCGAIVAADARFCRECGADDQAGWNDSTPDWSNEADDEFDYDDFLRREFPDQAPAAGANWPVVLLVLVLCLGLLIVLV